MEINLHKFLANAKRVAFVLALAVFSHTVYSQTTYTFNYTGSTQTIALLGGSYSISCWGGNGGTTAGGKGGYSTGSITITSPTTLYINTGGAGTATNATGSGNAAGGWNGGGAGSCYSSYGTSGGGGGGSDVRTTQNTTYANRIIVAGGGGGGSVPGQYGYAGGNGGGTTGGTGANFSGYWAGQGGSQTAGGSGTTESNSTVGAGVLGVGGSHASTAPSSGWAGCGGGGGYYGGSAGGAVHSGGGGGSSYIGGVSSGTTIMSGQSGFVANPVTTGHGLVLIKELCSINITATGLNSGNSLCSGNSVTLTTNAVSNYSWSNGATTQSIVVSPTSSGIYSVAGTSSAACNASSSLSITVNGAVPSLSVANSVTSSICVGKTATLTASGALFYSWAGGATTVTNGVSFFPTATTVYTVTGTNGCGQSTATTTITIAPLIVNATTSSSLVCQGSTVALTATSSVNGYTWAPIMSSNNPLTTAPQGNTIFTVTASDGTCVGTATVAVNTNPIPTINVVASNSLVCDGSVVTLTASGASSYTWTGLNSNSAVISATPVGATNYQVSGSNSFGCSSSNGQVILTLPAPTVSVSATKMIVCVGGSVNLTATSAAGVTFAWVNGPATPGNLVNPTSPTTYSVVGTGTNGCPSQETMITINTLSTNLSVSAATTAICEGKSTTLTATGANTYTWTGIPSFQGNALVTPATTTVYTVVANTTITGLSCPSTTNISITVNSNPIIKVTATKTVVCRTDANIVLTATGAVTYSWSANTGSTNTTAGNVSVHPIILNNNIYSVIGMDANGCVNSGSVTIRVNTCNGISELSGIANTVMVYPNPSNGEFNVSTTSEITLKVINELGQEVRTLQLSNENNYKVTLTNLTGGIYFLIGQNSEGKVSQKNYCDEIK